MACSQTCSMRGALLTKKRPSRCSSLRYHQHSLLLDRTFSRRLPSKLLLLSLLSLHLELQHLPTDQHTSTSSPLPSSLLAESSTPQPPRLRRLSPRPFPPLPPPRSRGTSTKETMTSSEPLPPLLLLEATSHHHRQPLSLTTPPSTFPHSACPFLPKLPLSLPPSTTPAYLFLRHLAIPLLPLLLVKPSTVQPHHHSDLPDLPDRLAHRDLLLPTLPLHLLHLPADPL
jgi:hypothetical protein